MAASSNAMVLALSKILNDARQSKSLQFPNLRGSPNPLYSAMNSIGGFLNSPQFYKGALSLLEPLAVCMQSIRHAGPASSSGYTFTPDQQRFLELMWAEVCKHYNKLSEDDLFSLLTSGNYYSQSNALQKVLERYQNPSDDIYLVLDLDKDSRSYDKSRLSMLHNATTIRIVDKLPTPSSLTSRQVVFAFPALLTQESKNQFEKAVADRNFDALIPLVKNIQYHTGRIVSHFIDIQDQNNWHQNETPLTQDIPSNANVLDAPGMDEINAFIATTGWFKPTIEAGVYQLLNAKKHPGKLGTLFKPQFHGRQFFGLLFNNNQDLLLVCPSGKGSGLAILLENRDGQIKVRNFESARYSSNNLDEVLPFSYASFYAATLIPDFFTPRAPEEFKLNDDLKYMISLALNGQLAGKSLVEELDRITTDYIQDKMSIQARKSMSSQIGKLFNPAPSSSQTVRVPQHSLLPFALPRDVIAQTPSSSQVKQERPASPHETEILVAAFLLELVGDNDLISQEYQRHLDGIIKNIHYQIPATIGIDQRLSLEQARLYVHDLANNKLYEPALFLKAINQLRRLSGKELESYAVGRWPDQTKTLHDLIVETSFNEVAFMALLQAPDEIAKLNARRWTPLMTAIYVNNRPAIEHLLSRMSLNDLNNQSLSGSSALMMAVAQASTNSFKDTSIIERLLQQAANPDLEDTSGNSARKMVLAWQSQHPETDLSFILRAMDASRVVRPAVPSSSSSLSMVPEEVASIPNTVEELVLSNEEEEFLKLLSLGTDEEFALFLNDHKALIDKRWADQQTSIMKAVEFGSDSKVQILVGLADDPVALLSQNETLVSRVFDLGRDELGAWLLSEPNRAVPSSSSSTIESVAPAAMSKINIESPNETFAPFYPWNNQEPRIQKKTGLLSGIFQRFVEASTSRDAPPSWGLFNKKLTDLMNSPLAKTVQGNNLHYRLLELKLELDNHENPDLGQLRSAINNLVRVMQADIQQETNESRLQLLVNLTHILVGEPVSRENCSSKLQNYIDQIPGQSQLMRP